MTTPQADEEATLIAEARRFVGVPTATVRRGRDPVNTAMINHWCDAFGDRNPVYVDPAAGAVTRHGGLIAPPAMLGTWSMDSPDGDQTAQGGPRSEVLRRLEQAGYTAVVATNYEQDYLRALQPGDLLTEEISVEDLTEPKDTGLGRGCFLTVRHDYLDQAGELVGTARMRLLKFRPPDRPPAQVPGPRSEEQPRRPRPPVNRDNAFFWEGVAAGELRIQRCDGCGALRHPPRPMCGSCRSTAWTAVPVSGRGQVYSYAIHHHPPLPGIELPHVALLVELEEGVRMVSSLTQASPDDVAIGLPVEVAFTEVDDDLTLPLFRLAREGAR